MAEYEIEPKARMLIGHYQENGDEFKRKGQVKFTWPNTLVQHLPMKNVMDEEFDQNVKSVDNVHHQWIGYGI